MPTNTIKEPTIRSDHATINSNKSDHNNHSKISNSRITRCPHTDQRHYAKNMCVRCYKKMGRTKAAWLCKHHDRPHYARGKCQSCYLCSYLKVRPSKHLELLQQAQPETPS